MYFYESLRQRFTGGKPDIKSLNFKLHGHNAGDYRIIINALKAFLDLDTAIGCPGHTTSIINIQKITDNAIYCQPKFNRKQKHNNKIKNLFGIEYQRIEIIQKNKIQTALLCDDISTTGETLYIFEMLLRQKCGIERVEKFVIGHKKEDADKVFMVAIQEYFDIINFDINMAEIDLNDLLAKVDS